MNDPRCMVYSGSVHRFDPDQRAQEKQASRDEDDLKLAAGEVTPEELTRKNSMFSPEFIKRCRILRYK